MHCKRVFMLALAGVLSLATAAWAQVIIPESTLQRHGLTRSWRAQVELNRAVDRLAYITQYDGVLYVQSKHAYIQALDAETGRKLWSARMGDARQVSTAPGVSKKYMAVINGSTLYVLDRANGRQKYQRRLGGPPGPGPALTDTMVFVFMVNGLVEGYQLEDHRALPWIYRAVGRVMTQPIVSDVSMAWTTDRGYFYVAEASPPKVRFRVETQAEISSRPASWSPYLYACSQNGFLYAVNEQSGQTAWKFPAGSTLSTEPSAVNGVVYIILDTGGMVAIDGQTGQQRWLAPHITQFCSISHGHVYAIDNLERLVILDAEHGTRLATLPLGDVQIKLHNQQSDRIYLASETGVIQCLHELSQQAPLVYTPPPSVRLVDKAEDRSGQGATSGEGAASDEPANMKKGAADETGDEGNMTDDEDEKPEADSESPFDK